MMQPDGIHPTREAQPLLLETLLPVIEEALP
jgi:lysophospholipase L1-like esterase